MAPGLAQCLGHSWRSVNRGGMNGPSVSEGRAVPVIGEGVSSSQIRILLFKNGALREYIQFSEAFPYVEPVIPLKPRINELFSPCRESLVEPSSYLSGVERVGMVFVGAGTPASGS